MMFHPFFVMNSKYLETHTFSIYFHEFVWRISVQFCFLSDCRSTKSKISRSIFLNCNSQQNVFEFGLIWISLRVLFIILVKSIWIFTLNCQINIGRETCEIFCLKYIGVDMNFRHNKNKNVPIAFPDIFVMFSFTTSHWNWHFHYWYSLEN